MVIAGAGPVGLLIALRLGQANINTLVLERHSSLLPAIRAMVYQPLVLPALQSLGILEKVKEKAFLNREGIFWRDVGGNVLAKLPMEEENIKGDGCAEDDFEGILLLGQERMTRLILEALEEFKSVQVRFGYQACGVDQQDQERPAKVLVRKPKAHASDDDVIVEADQVIAADGANSTIRNALGIPFEGFTWPNMKMIGADIYYDFIGENGYGPLNFIVVSLKIHKEQLDLRELTDE